MNRSTWAFSDYMEELILIEEVVGEIPGMDNVRDNFVREMWERFPQECEEIHLLKR